MSSYQQTRKPNVSAESKEDLPIMDPAAARGHGWDAYHVWIDRVRDPMRQALRGRTPASP